MRVANLSVAYARVASRNNRSSSSSWLSSMRGSSQLNLDRSGWSFGDSSAVLDALEAGAGLFIEALAKVRRGYLIISHSAQAAEVIISICLYETAPVTDKLLCISGSTRTESLNTRLAKCLATSAGIHGATATLLDLAEYPLPLYNGDLESDQGLPAEAAALQELFEAHDGFLIASPEYNGFFSPLLKNTIDWVTRPNPAADQKPAPYTNKVAGLVAASPGRLGGLRGLGPLRQLLAGLGVTVIGPQLAVASAHEKFNDDGSLSDEEIQQQLDNVVRQVIACKIQP